MMTKGFVTYFADKSAVKAKPGYLDGDIGGCPTGSWKEGRYIRQLPPFSASKQIQEQLTHAEAYNVNHLDYCFRYTRRGFSTSPAHVSGLPRISRCPV